MRYSECLNCGEQNEVLSASRDELGWHTTCSHCGGSYDIDIEDFLLPNGIEVEMPDGTYGVIDGNDAKTARESEDIRYCVCPNIFTLEADWSQHYRMFKRSELAVVESWRLTRRYKDLVSRVCHYPRNLEHSNVPCYNCADRTKCNADIFERLAQYEDSGYKPDDLLRYRALENELIEASETTLLELHEWLKSKRAVAQKKEVLIAKDRYDILNNPAVAKKYPRLYVEVLEHEQSSGGERCALTYEAYSEWKEYRIDETIEYRK